MHNKRKVCLVTGASRGIGAAIVRELAKSGMHIVINYLSSERAAVELAAENEALGVRSLLLKADVSSASDVEKMFSEIESTWGGVDLLVNNAGVDLCGLITETSEEQFERIMDINLKGPFLCCRRALPHMIRQRFGRIVNISSIWGLNGASCESVYAASKGGLIALTRSLAKEVGPSGVTVNALAPGPVKTDMMDAELDEDEQRELAADIPAGRFGYPQEIASACRYLLTDDAAFINGHVLVLDGGWKV